MSHTHGVSNAHLPQSTLSAADRIAAPKPPAATEALGTQGHASTTNLSGAGTLLAAASSDDVRTDKVAALKSAIDSGTYSVPAGDVADKLIAHLLG